MSAFIKALLFVVVAEMGDKTQLLAMAFASKYKAKDVMLGVFIATIFNHAIAVGVGNYLSSVIPMEYVKIAAAISFIFFGLWTIRGDEIDDEDEKKTKFGPVITVAIAFFIAEMGDKTQLMTVAIAAQFKQPIWVLTGTTVGMLVADGIGILGGSWLAKHVPEKYIKWGAALVFMIFGIITLIDVLPYRYLSAIYIIPFCVVLSILVYIVGFRNKNSDEDKKDMDNSEM
ncbi:hypothetical protein Q428_09920 [Fervidicella metallireducens AeB]|uniref:GDT1 family protein n=1 Tax=Fervidicella metallireducens AeB TaxID=1403537 RepID=A0A017RUI1_9CLOT|nr:TMEM165/GDT1 family protein [Fervidicella metallireducens]EYE88044.1 hypothetical protein Q428_09920 [Fervidicella metallireducens AeB]